MRHSPRKRFGQNFLQHAHVIAGIIQAINPQKEDNLLEIGPGLGALTKPLLRHVARMTAIEIDRDLHQHLQNLPETQDKLHVLAADALTVDYHQFGAHLRIVGNLPYNISTPLLIHLMSFHSQIADMHFMLQKEVVERIAASPGCKAYGRLSVMLQYYCNVEHLFNVPPEAFEPRPKVDSAIVRLTPHSHNPFEFVEMAHLEYIVARAFAMRRKTLANNLKGIIDSTQLETMGIDAGKRPEQISVAEYVQLAKRISI